MEDDFNALLRELSPLYNVRRIGKPLPVGQLSVYPDNDRVAILSDQEILDRFNIDLGGEG